MAKMYEIPVGTSIALVTEIDEGQSTVSTIGQNPFMKSEKILRYEQSDYVTTLAAANGKVLIFKLPKNEKCQYIAVREESVETR